MKVLPRGLTRRPSIFGPLGLLGFFGCFCSGKRCLPQKKRDGLPLLHVRGEPQVVGLSPAGRVPEKFVSALP